MSASSHAECKKRRTEDIKAMSRAKAAAGLTFLHGRVDEAVAAARFAEIPADDRGLTARLMGDPLVGRRAIDIIRKVAP